MATRNGANGGLSSAGHRLGQIIGDWWETKVLLPTLQSLATDLDLFLDNRRIQRTCRGGKLNWQDEDGNAVDYDFVLELDGSPSQKGLPVAFFECFWRSGARHSKDKARDDTNKLLPMRQTYATARFLAIAACGEFTEPARDYVLSRSVELLFVPKQNIVAAFAASGLTIDYDDALAESKKKALVAQLESKFVGKLEDAVKENLIKHIGTTTLSSFKSTVRGALTASPQTIKITALKLSEPSVFLSIQEATDFLSAPSFDFSGSGENYRYDVLYSDGTQFSRSLNSIQEVRDVHSSLCRLVNHMNRISE
jgi:hypothetical protein